MSGLGQLIPYFECQYPQVLPFSVGQESSMVINSGGLADYVAPFNFPIPQYLSPGNMKGLGCGGDCGGTCGCGGLGLFDSMDPTTWGAGEFGVLAAGAFVLYSLVSLANKTERGYKRAKGAVGKKVRGVKSSVRRRKEAASTFFGG